MLRKETAFASDGEGERERESATSQTRTWKKTSAGSESSSSTLCNKDIGCVEVLEIQSFETRNHVWVRLQAKKLCMFAIHNLCHGHICQHLPCVQARTVVNLSVPLETCLSWMVNWTCQNQPKASRSIQKPSHFSDLFSSMLCPFCKLLSISRLLIRSETMVSTTVGYKY